MTIDATAVSSSFLVVDYDSQDATKAFNARLLPGQHHIQASGAVLWFTVSNAGKVDYDASLAGVLNGKGTSTLRVGAPTVQIDARGLASGYLNLDYVVQDRTKVVSAQLLPGAHHIQTWGGDVLWFNVGTNGKVSYDASLEGVFTGNGTSLLKVAGRTVTIDATKMTSSYFNLNYTTYAFSAPLQLALTPGQHFIQSGSGLYYFTMSKSGMVDYDPSLEGIFRGRGTKTLSFSG